MRRPNPAAANARGGGGIWGDGASATSIRGRPDLRDPRARRGAAYEEEEEGGAGAAGKALGAIILALILGAGAAYGYFTVSTPKLAPSLAQPSASPSAGPSASPTPHATSTPHADRSPSSSPVTAQASGAYVFVAPAVTPRV